VHDTVFIFSKILIVASTTLADKMTSTFSFWCWFVDRLLFPWYPVCIYDLSKSCQRMQKIRTCVLSIGFIKTPSMLHQTPLSFAPQNFASRSCLYPYILLQQSQYPTIGDTAQSAEIYSPSYVLLEPPRFKSFLCRYFRFCLDWIIWPPLYTPKIITIPYIR
jgi:hypothetical protein